MPDSSERGPVDRPDPEGTAAAPEAAAPTTIDAELGDLDDADDDLVDADAPLGLDVAFTPRQILGGFALLAALVLLLRRRNRRG